MRRLLILSCAVVLIDTVFFAALAPLVPYFAQELGTSIFVIGILNGAYGAGIIAGAVPAASLTARIGVRGTALLGLVILALASLPFGFAEGADSLILLRFVGGFGSACSWIGVFTWVVSAAGRERRGQMIGTLVSAAVVGAMLGPMLGSAAARFGLPIVFTGVSLLSLAVAIGVWREPTPARATRWRWRELPLLANAQPAIGLALIALAPLLFGTLVTLAPHALSRLGWGTTAIGVVFLLAALFEAVAHPLAGHWTDRDGCRGPILASLGASIALLIALPLAHHVWGLAVLVILSAGMFNLALTPGTALFTHSFDELGGGQALGFALTNVAWAGGFAAGAPLGGLLSSIGGDVLAYLPLAVLCGGGLLLVRRRV